MNIGTTYLVLFLAAFISGGLIIFTKPKMGLSLKLLLSFSGAYLLALCFLHLIPELYVSSSFQIGLYILIGFVLQWFLEIFSKGIEHGHFHSHGHHHKKSHFPYAIFISLWLHSFIEGMALIEPDHHHLGHHHHENSSLLLGIVIHKIPIAIVLATLLMSEIKKKWVELLSIVIFAISAPLGLYLGQHFGATFLEDVSILMALAVGVFLHISTTILFESTENHTFNFKKFGVIILGFILAIVTL